MNNDDKIIRTTITEYLKARLPDHEVRITDDGISIESKSRLSNQWAIIHTRGCIVDMKCQSFDMHDPGSCPKILEAVKICLRQGLCGYDTANGCPNFRVTIDHGWSFARKWIR